LLSNVDPRQRSCVDELAKRMMVGQLLRADGTDAEDRCCPCGTDNETDQLDGLGITPLQIADDQQTRTVGDNDARLTASNNRWR
jgi:hypothetical protein